MESEDEEEVHNPPPPKRGKKIGLTKRATKVCLFSTTVTLLEKARRKRGRLRERVRRERTQDITQI